MAAVEAQLRPGGGFEQFLKGSEAARQRTEGVGAFVHRPLPGLHVRDLHQLREVPVGDLAAEQPNGYDTDCRASGLQHGVGQRAHDADAGSSVDQTHVGGHHGRSQFPGQGMDAIVVAVPGSTEDPKMAPSSDR